MNPFGRITQRGNRRQKTFFSNKDCTTYLVSKPELWKYSSAASHVYGKEDTLLSRTSPLNETIDNRKEFLRLTPLEQEIKMLQQHERTGRLLGSDGFLARLEKPMGRLLKPKKPGRKSKKVEKQ